MQTSVAVTSSGCPVYSDEFRHSPKNVGEISEPCSTSAVTNYSTIAGIDSGNPGKLSAVDFSVPTPVSLGGCVTFNGFSVIKSGGEVVVRSSSAGHAERRMTQSSCSQYSLSSLPSCVQSLRPPVMCCSTALIPSPPNLLSRSPTASTPPVAVNWEIKRSPVSTLNSLRSSSQHTELFSSRNASVLSTAGFSSPAENNRHRSVKAGSTWFPSELQTSSHSRHGSITIVIVIQL